jgi:VCBS repeat-containing protein
MPPRPSRLAPTLRVSLVAAAVALAGLVTAASVRADEPPRTAQPTVTGPASVTVQQGHTTTFQLQMTGSGTLDCAIVPPGPPALPWAAVFPEIRAVKSFSSGFISQGGQFNVDFFAGAVVGDTCAASWDGAPDPVIIEATFEAACDAPAQTYDERLLGTVSGAPMLGIQTPRIDFIVTEGNCVPVARDDSYQTDEGTPLIVNAADGVLDNDSDRDNDPLAAGSPVGPGHGSLTLNADGSFTYTPNADFTGEDSFTYQASDGVDSDMATVTIDVLPVDDTPPSISYTLTPASPGDGGWYRTPVTLDWTVADNESTATPTGCVDTTVNTDQAMTAYTCSATSEGGTAGPESVGIGYDATLPTVNPSLAEGTNFPIGASAPTVTPGAVDPDPGRARRPGRRSVTG